MFDIVNYFKDDENIKISAYAQPFFANCPERVLDDLRSKVKAIQPLLSDTEKLFLINWYENKIERTSVIFYVIDKSIKTEEKTRFMLSFHAPEFTFYSVNSAFRCCVVRDVKWQAFSENLIGFKHGLDN